MGQESQLRRLAGTRKSKASPPMLSHEFVIQNHGDIFSCIIVLVLAGFMVQATAPIAQVFVAPQYNTTVEGQPTTFTNGKADLATIAFYTICCIVAHAILQEYILDKLQRRLHLSKVKTAKFSESGHLATFAMFSVGFAVYIMKEGNYSADIPSLWTAYPHVQMNMLTKVYLLVQLAYWCHQFPEFYFAKVKKDDAAQRTVYSILYLAFIGAAYAMNFNRIALVLLAVHYTCEAVFHLTRIAHFAEKPSISVPAFKLYNFLFVSTRLVTIAMAFVTFWYGMRAGEQKTVDLAAGNFNTATIRVACLASVCFLQAYFMWGFIMFHLRQMRERSTSAAANKKVYNMRGRSSKAERKAEKEVRDLPEADQHTRVLRSAKKEKSY